MYTPKSREYYVSKCRFYNGNEGANSDSGNGLAADYERVWVDSHFSEEGLDLLRGNLEGYKKFGLADFDADDEVPITLKALLWSRFMHWGSGYETKRDFIDWYYEFYGEEKPNRK